MGSVTTWTRLEPRARSGDMRPGLEARIHDPLWLLGRQWQVGEFQGEDAGSPLFVRVRTEVAPLGTVRAPGGDPQPYDGATPLEAIVEREPPGAPQRRADAEAGLHFLRLLTDEGVAAYRQPFAGAFPFSTPADADPASRRSLGLLAGRVPDGRALAAALRGGLPAQPPVAAADRAKVQAAATRYLAWFDGVVTQAPAGQHSWQRTRFEYRFEVSAHSAGADVVLSAPEHPGGPLDWHSFVQDTAATLPAPASADVVVSTTLPARAGYAGMPAARFWELEDSRVDFGGVEAAPTDLARMLVLDFATIYGNDWYVVPVPLPVGTLSHVRSVVVGDTFGGRWSIEPASEQGWTMYELTRIGPGADTTDRLRRLFLPPTLVGGLESEPLEDVLLLRDEDANVAWAVERTVQGAAGRPVDRVEAWHEQRRRTGGAPPPAGAPVQIAPLVYRLATDVPEHWIPLVPEEMAPGATVLRVSAIERPGRGPVVPQGRLLEPGTELLVPEEEVPPEGARITRAWQYARWRGGSAHLWRSRRKQAGRGGGASGLGFDTVEPWQPARLALAYETLELAVTVGPLDGRPVDLARMTPGQVAFVRWRVRNRGAETWPRVGPAAVVVGTADPRDHGGRLAAPTWLGPTRPAAAIESSVGPGQVASFLFEIRAPTGNGAFTEAFDLVAGQRWFDGPRLVLAGQVAAPTPPVNTTPPAVSGRPATGQGLVVTPGTWLATGELTLSYRWQRGTAAGASFVDIAGAVGQVCAVGSADVGSTIRAVVTATDAVGTSSATSAPTAVVVLTPVAPVNTAPPGFSGTPQVGQTLFATTGTWTGTAPVTYTYQWRRLPAGGTWTDIPRATSASYAIVVADLGSSLRVTVTATNAADAVAAVSLPTPPVLQRPTNTVPPSIAGTPTVGQTLTAGRGTWVGTAPVTYAYQWRRHDAAGGGGTDIPGAAGGNYVLTAVDQGSTIRVAVTASNVAGTTTLTSAATAVVTPPPAPPVNTLAPSISGQPIVGYILTVDEGKWDGEPSPSITLQWERCDEYGSGCQPIPGATTSSYVPRSDKTGTVPGKAGPTALPGPIGSPGSDVGSTLRVVVTATNPSGVVKEATKPTGVVSESGVPPDPDR